jgi:hypothetical protein
MAISFSELKGVYREAKEIYDSSISWEAKYDLIFSERISRKVSFSWYDPDTSYEEDLTEFMRAFDYYMGNIS